MTIIAEKNIESVQAETYKLRVPNFVTTADGEEIDIGRIEYATVSGLNSQKADLLDQIKLIDDKLAAIAAANK